MVRQRPSSAALCAADRSLTLLRFPVMLCFRPRRLLLSAAARVSGGRCLAAVGPSQCGSASIACRGGSPSVPPRRAAAHCIVARARRSSRRSARRDAQMISWQLLKTSMRALLKQILPPPPRPLAGLEDMPGEEAGGHDSLLSALRALEADHCLRHAGARREGGGDICPAHDVVWVCVTLVVLECGVFGIVSSVADAFSLSSALIHRTLASRPKAMGHWSRSNAVGAADSSRSNAECCVGAAANTVGAAGTASPAR
jgi:hypothetical protein